MQKVKCKKDHQQPVGLGFFKTYIKGQQYELTQFDKALFEPVKEYKEPKKQKTAEVKKNDNNT